MIENISKKHTGKGNSRAILHFSVNLNNRQIRLLEKLPTYNSKCIMPKSEVRMSDLSALTALTNDEFAMELRLQGYRWSGHTHPGTDDLCLMPSDGDKEILKKFPQRRTTIYNSLGKYYILAKEG